MSYTSYWQHLIDLLNRNAIFLHIGRILTTSGLIYFYIGKMFYFLYFILFVGLVVVSKFKMMLKRSICVCANICRGVLLVNLCDMMNDFILGIVFVYEFTMNVNTSHIFSLILLFNSYNGYMNNKRWFNGLYRKSTKV